MVALQIIGSIMFAIAMYNITVNKSSIRDALMACFICLWLGIVLFSPLIGYSSGVDKGYINGYKQGQVDAIEGKIKYEKKEIPAIQIYVEKAKK